MKTPIVIDTSVFISALIGPTGASRLLIRQCLECRYLPLMGNALFLEYESVSSRDNIRELCPLRKDEIETLLQALMSVSKWIPIYYNWRPNLTDEGDHHLIELAIAGNAKIIATHNLKDFQNAELLFPELQILKPEAIVRE